MTPYDPCPRGWVPEFGCVGGVVAFMLGMSLAGYAGDKWLWLAGLGVAAVVGAFARGRWVTCPDCGHRTYCIGRLPSKCPHCKESWGNDLPPGPDPHDPSW